MAISFAFISSGRLLVSQDGAPPREIESQFAREMRERESKARRRHDWKAESDELVAGLPGAGVWGKQGAASHRPFTVECGALARGPQPGAITFALQAGGLGGLFDADLADGSERRLLHRADFRVEEMERHPRHGGLAYATHAGAGTIHLALKRPDESAGHELTDGDSLDQAPSWVDGREDRLVYQSAGLARTPRGGIALVGPYVINELDLSSGEITTLLEDADRDLLLPHQLADGTLLFLQRPYEDPGRIHYGRTLLDVILLPWRLLATLFHYLNLMSLLYSGKPLSEAGARRGREPDLRKMILWGRAVEAEKRAQSFRPDEASTLVPKSWELVRRSPAGDEQVLARGVLAFDVGTDGRVVFTDGRSIFQLGAEGKAEKLLDHFPVEKLVALD